MFSSCEKIKKETKTGLFKACWWLHLLYLFSVSENDDEDENDECDEQEKDFHINILLSHPY